MSTMNPMPVWPSADCTETLAERVKGLARRTTSPTEAAILVAAADRLLSLAAKANPQSMEGNGNG